MKRSSGFLPLENGPFAENVLLAPSKSTNEEALLRKYGLNWRSARDSEHLPINQTAHDDFADGSDHSARWLVFARLPQVRILLA